MLMLLQREESFFLLSHLIRLTYEASVHEHAVYHKQAVDELTA
jgi:hypothetical protein